jgi:hypothetical protein
MKTLVQLLWRVPVLLCLGLLAPTPPLLASDTERRAQCPPAYSLADETALQGALASLLSPDDFPGWIDLGGSFDVYRELGVAYYRRSFTTESGGRVRQLSLTTTVEERPQLPPQFVQPVGTVIRVGNSDVRVIEGPPIGPYSMWETSLQGPIETIFGLQAIAVVFQVGNTRAMVALRSDDLSAEAATTATAEVATVVAQRLGWPANEQCQMLGGER